MTSDSVNPMARLFHRAIALLSHSAFKKGAEHGSDSSDPELVDTFERLSAEKSFRREGTCSTGQMRSVVSTCQARAEPNP